MNEELTNEVLEALGSCMNTCGDDCKARRVCSPGQSYVRRKLATALLEERAKPKVWEFAPDDAIQAQITWFTKNDVFTGIKTYNREVPKTQARKDAEELFDELSSHCLGRKQGIDAIEALLNKYAKELEGEA